MGEVDGRDGWERAVPLEQTLHARFENRERMGKTLLEVGGELA
jgi:hypothetical protein